MSKRIYSFVKPEMVHGNGQEMGQEMGQQKAQETEQNRVQHQSRRDNHEYQPIAKRSRFDKQPVHESLQQRPQSEPTAFTTQVNQWNQKDGRQETRSSLNHMGGIQQTRPSSNPNEFKRINGALLHQFAMSDNPRNESQKINTVVNGQEVINEMDSPQNNQQNRQQHNLQNTQPISQPISQPNVQSLSQPLHQLNQPLNHLNHLNQPFQPFQIINQPSNSFINQFQNQAIPENHYHPINNMPMNPISMHIPMNNEFMGTSNQNYVDTSNYLPIESHSDPSSINIIIHNHLISSDYFLSKAHSIVLTSNTSEGQQNYFKMIKISIKSLLITIKKYYQHLNPHLQLYIFLKLGKLYLEETENISKADDYICRAIAIASRNNLVDIKFHAEYLAAQLLEKSDTNLVQNYLNEKILAYQSMGLGTYAHLFQVLKIKNLFLHDYGTGLVVLQKLSRDGVDPLIRIYCLIYQANLQLYRGSPKYSLELLEEAEKVQLNHPQLMAMLMIQKYLAYTQTNYEEAKNYSKVLNAFVSGQQKLGWTNWAEDGTFSIQLQHISYQISFLNSDEFVINFYFLTGINLLSETANGKRKSKKVFDKCLQIIDKQLSEMSQKDVTDGSNENFSRTFSINHLSQSILRLRFYRFTINYYQAWMGFLGDEPRAINYMNEFMLEYNEGKICDEEMCYFRLLLPKMFYLFGIYYHSIGDIQAAKYYYIKVRNITSSKGHSKLSYLQLSLGIGCENLSGEREYNELFIYSSLHLLILTEYEVKMISASHNENLGHYLKLANVLHQDLNVIFLPKVSSNKFNTNFTGANEIVQLTYQIILKILDDSTNLAIERLVKFDESNGTCFPFFNNLVNYLVYTETTDMAQKAQYLGKCVAVVSQATTDTERIICIFILRSLIQKFRSSGENDKANMGEMQLEYFYNKLGEKIEFMRGNVDIKIDDRA